MKTFKLLCYVLIIISFAFVRAPAYSYTADVEEICGRNYFSSVHEVLQKAQGSITVVMYFVNFDPQKVDNVAVLVNDLVEAHRRGVKVKVILDRNIQFREQREAGEGFYVEEKNKRVFDYLREAGIEVYYDNENTFTHAKSIVIDDYLVILGSNNWSESSLSRNNETAVIIKSRELAKEFIDYFDSIAIDFEESRKEAVSYKSYLRMY